jgi:hypothetical protein
MISETVGKEPNAVEDGPGPDVPMTRSAFLFPTASAWIGAARLLDFGQSLNRFNYSLSPGEADSQALLSDWLAVGDDINWAAKEYKLQIQKDSV